MNIITCFIYGEILRKLEMDNDVPCLLTGWDRIGSLKIQGVCHLSGGQEINSTTLRRPFSQPGIVPQSIFETMIAISLQPRKVYGHCRILHACIQRSGSFFG
jgi:hypothetical protein